MLPFAVLIVQEPARLLHAITVPDAGTAIRQPVSSKLPLCTDRRNANRHEEMEGV